MGLAHNIYRCIYRIKDNNELVANLKGYARKVYALETELDILQKMCADLNKFDNEIEVMDLNNLITELRQDKENLRKHAAESHRTLLVMEQRCHAMEEQLACIRSLSLHAESPGTALAEIRTVLNKNRASNEQTS